MESSSATHPRHKRTMLILTNSLALWFCVTVSDLLAGYMAREYAPNEAEKLDADIASTVLQHAVLLPLLIIGYFLSLYVYDSVLRPSLKWFLQAILGLSYGATGYPLMYASVAMIYGRADHDSTIQGGIVTLLGAKIYMWIYETTGYSLMYFLGLFLIFNMANRLELADERVRLERLNAEWTALKLQVLRWQINPHFLFNSLNTVSALLRSAPGRADSVLAKFSALLRITLREQENIYTSVGSELGYVHSYLDMEMVRFEDRLKLSIEADEDVLDARIPCFLVQPLVENAIKHGIARIPGPALVSVSASRQADRLVLSVRNTSSSKYAVDQPGTGGLGIKNLRERLSVIYRESFTFTSGRVENDDWNALIDIPFERYAAEEAHADRGSWARDGARRASG